MTTNEPSFRARTEAGAAAADLDLEQVLRTLWRRRAVVAGGVVGAALLALLVVLQLPPQYTATTLLMLAPRGPQVMEAADVVPALGTDSPVVHSEVEVLRSRALAEAVVEAEDLAGDPEFNPALTPPALWRVALGLGQPEAPDAPLVDERVVEAFREALRVEALNRSLVVAVRVTSINAAKAARLADAVAGLYLERQVRAKLSATRGAADWLAERVETLRREATQAEAAVAAYRARHGLGQDREGSLAAEERVRLSAALAEARAARADAEARHQRLRHALAEAPASVGEVLASPVIHRLREQEAQVVRTLADLSARYGPLHPRLAETQAELDDLRGQIAAEAARVADGVADEARVARVREQALADSLAALEHRRAGEGAASAPLLALEQEAAAAKALHESFLRRFKEASEQVALQAPDARVVSPAAVPVRPSWPRKTVVVAAAGGVGLLLALALVFILERLDRGLRRPEDAERRLGRPVLGQMPLLRPCPAVPDAVAGEEMRQIRTALALSSQALAAAERPPRVVAVTSSLPGEGKTTLCLWLARTAGPDKRVVVVDADLRRPRLGDLAGATDGPGLGAVLAGEATVDEALRPGPTEGLSVLPGRAVGAVAGDLLGGAAMRAVLEDLRGRFDLVVVDTPPVLPVADARVLAPLVDAVVYAVRWEKTPDDVALQGLERLAAAGPAPFVVLTQVDLKRQASYGYGGYVRYYGRYGGYYARP